MVHPFEFYQIVKVKTDIDKFSEINGLEGGIIGRGPYPEGTWTYKVWIDSKERAWPVPHDCLVPTGKMGKREDYFTDESVRVRVDLETGEGSLVEDD